MLDRLEALEAKLRHLMTLKPISEAMAAQKKEHDELQAKMKADAEAKAKKEAEAKKQDKTEPPTSPPANVWPAPDSANPLHPSP